MPGRDELALAAELRLMAPAMPVAILTDNTQNEIIAHARELGAAFLSKPLTETALTEFLADAEA
jgi:AmiR/NasT family two-component response regulator